MSEQFFKFHQNCYRLVYISIILQPTSPYWTGDQKVFSSLSFCLNCALYSFFYLMVFPHPRSSASSSEKLRFYRLQSIFSVFLTLRFTINIFASVKVFSVRRRSTCFYWNRLMKLAKQFNVENEINFLSRVYSVSRKNMVT